MTAAPSVAQGLGLHPVRWSLLVLLLILIGKKSTYRVRQEICPSDPLEGSRGTNKRGLNSFLLWGSPESCIESQGRVTHARKFGGSGESGNEVVCHWTKRSSDLDFSFCAASLGNAHEIWNLLDQM